MSPTTSSRRSSRPYDGSMHSSTAARQTIRHNTGESPSRISERHENRPESRQESRLESGPESKPESKPDSRQESRQENKQETRQETRQESRQETRRENRLRLDTYGGVKNGKTQKSAPSLDSGPSGASSGDRSSKSYIRPYFRSRIVSRNKIEKPWLNEPKAKWSTLIPLCGLGCGLALIGLQAYLGWASVTINTYCLVMEDNFDGPSLNSSLWNQEVQLGGYGNGEFELTTSGTENVFIENGKLIIKPTLQDKSLLNSSYALLNLTADGTCTSDTWYNCWAATNATNHTIMNPVKSGRINTKGHASIRFGRVEVVAKMPAGDWLWPAIWMLPVNDVYGPWPASGEIDIVESRGNNYTYKGGGNNYATSTLHWGPTKNLDAHWKTSNRRQITHTTYADAFHTFGLEWNEKYLYTYVDSRLRQIFYTRFNKPFWERGKFPQMDKTGTLINDPWDTNRDNTPFDTPFYLIVNLAVGGTNGYFQDPDRKKPWDDNAVNASSYFWQAKDEWFPTWTGKAQLEVDNIKMWQQCN